MSEYEYFMVQVTKKKAASVQLVLQSRSLEATVLHLPAAGSRINEADYPPGVVVSDMNRAIQAVQTVFFKINEALRKAPVYPVGDVRGRARRFTLWIEGYAATGESATAQCLGTYEGVSLSDAAAAWYASQKDAKRRWGTFYVSKEGQPSVWGCRIFDNESLARESFG